MDAWLAKIIPNRVPDWCEYRYLMLESLTRSDDTWAGLADSAELMQSMRGEVTYHWRHRVPTGSGGDDNTSDDDTIVVTKPRTRTKKPSMYKVLLLNDDYTPMEFVVHVLQKVFNKGADEATMIMLHVHQRGVGVCGVFSYEVAETKVTQVMNFARTHQHPLQCTMEKD